MQKKKREIVCDDDECMGEVHELGLLPFNLASQWAQIDWVADYETKTQPIAIIIFNLKSHCIICWQCMAFLVLADEFGP